MANAASIAVPLAGVAVLPFVPWLGIALIGFALATSGSSKNPWYLWHNGTSLGSVCVINHSATELLTKWTLIGVYSTLKSARTDALMMCEESAIVIEP